MFFSEECVPTTYEPFDTPVEGVESLLANYASLTTRRPNPVRVVDGKLEVIPTGVRGSNLALGFSLMRYLTVMPKLRHKFLARAGCPESSWLDYPLAITSCYFIQDCQAVNSGTRRLWIRHSRVNSWSPSKAISIWDSRLLSLYSTPGMPLLMVTLVPSD